MAKVLSLDDKSYTDMELPEIFNQKVDPSFLKRAFLAEESNKFQLKYTDPLAGKRKAAELTKRRHAYKTTYGHQHDRTPRKTLSHIGASFSFVGAVAPQTVGGREAHPPKPERVLVKKLNKKERVLAIRMGIAASASKDAVSKFHDVGDISTLPLIIDDSINKISKTKEAVEAVGKMGLSEELSRIMKRRIRAGRGKMRGRRYKKKLGPILVTTDTATVRRALSNINFTIKKPGELTISDVTHAGMPGRLVIWTKSAVASLK